MNMKQLKDKANEAGKKIVFNRGLGGYQVTHGFTSSEVEIPLVDEKGKYHLNESQTAKLFSYI